MIAVAPTCPTCKAKDNILQPCKTYYSCGKCGTQFAAVPYPTLCINPSECLGLTCCPRKYACSE